LIHDFRLLPVPEIRTVPETTALPTGAVILSVEAACADATIKAVKIKTMIVEVLILVILPTPRFKPSLCRLPPRVRNALDDASYCLIGNRSVGN